MKYAIAAFALLLTGYGAWAIGPRERAYAYCDGGKLFVGGPVDFGLQGSGKVKLDCE